MKKLLLLSLVASALGGSALLSSTPGLTAHLLPDSHRTLVLPPDTTTVDPTGGYFFTGRLPKQFGRIDFIALATLDENANPAPLNGFVRVSPLSAPDYKTATITLQGEHLTFVTKAVKGISYRFDGNFSRLGNFPADPPPSDEVVLSGRFTKLKNGREVISRDVQLTYSAGD